jgi:hypothetical protein
MWTKRYSRWTRILLFGMWAIADAVLTVDVCQRRQDLVRTQAVSRVESHDVILRRILIR